MIIVPAPETHRLHHVIEFTGVDLLPSAESPERVDSIVAGLADAGFDRMVESESFGLEPVRRVHTPEYLEFLAVAHREWVQHEEVADTVDAIPLVFPTGQAVERPWNDIRGRFGRHSFDTDAIGANTFDAALAAADVALTGRRLIRDGERSVFAVCRPPGHHTSADRFGGYCYLNNAAIAAQAFADDGLRPAILDLDFHHGNGTQLIFYDRDDVLYTSLHADPKHDYPYFFGYADETGAGSGEGFNINFPLPAGTERERYLDALAGAAKSISAFGAEVLVVSLGVDTALEDPDSFALTADDYPRVGEQVAALGLPTLFVMEGGYNPTVLGRNVAAVLTGFEAS